MKKTVAIILFSLFASILLSCTSSIDTKLEPTLSPVTLWHMDEGIGDILHDATNNHNDGIINGATWASGKFGQALSFDGENDWVTVKQPFVFHKPTDATLSFWVKIMNPGEYSIFWTRGDEEDRNRFHIKLDILYWDTVNGTGQLSGGQVSLFDFSYSSPDGVPHFFRTVQIPGNQWVQIAVTRSGNTYSFYKDGEFEGEVTDANPDLPDYTGNWFIGRGYSRLGGWRQQAQLNMFYGLIDEVAMYDRALSVAEISQLADMPVSLPTYTPAPTPSPTP
jgi:hypothetical protein